jgi:hypothetical protein
MPKIELATIEWTFIFKDGEPQRPSPQLDIVQDNLREVAALVPDGLYRWTLTLDIEKAAKIPLPPEGYTFVLSGESRAGDLKYCHEHGWEELEGNESISVKGFNALARKETN